MVPGEADVECARMAKITNSAILTGDSDLLVHDLGLLGSVVFLNSLQLIEGTQDSTAPELRGQMIAPYELSRRLSIPSIQLFAYELYRNPRASFSELLRRAKEKNEKEERSSDYCSFLREYQHDPSIPTPMEGQLFSRHMDPRVSELFWQYELPETYSHASNFHIYLGILHEDHARRCSWEQSRAYRSLGYALLNLSRPATQRPQCIYEFVRRGGRIVSEQVTLAGEKTVVSDLHSLQKRLDLARSIFECGSSANFWFLFALSEVIKDLSHTTTVPTPKQLENFLGKGFMGKATEWADIHLLAQVQAVLYSLRMLQQLLQITAKAHDIGLYRYILEDLPPLYLLMRSRREITQSFSENETCRRAVYQIIKNYS